MNFPQNGAPQPPPLRLEEFKEVPCQACGCTWRKSVSAVKYLKHRFNPRHVLPTTTTWFFCAGCWVQVDQDGASVLPENQHFCPPEISKEMKRG